MSDKQRRDYEEFLEVDFSFEIPGLARFRVNAFNQNRGAGAVFRTIPSEVLSLEDLGAPKIFKELIQQPPVVYSHPLPFACRLHQLYVLDTGQEFLRFLSPARLLQRDPRRRPSGLSSCSL